MAMDTASDLDFQLVCALREIDPHNYSYLFQLCKNCNVNARQLRFLKKDHIRELIPENELGILAEFEYLLNQWQISKGFASFDTKIQLNRANESKNLIIGQGNRQILSNNETAKPEDSLTGLDSDEEDNNMSKSNIEKFDEVEEFTLENLVPKVLKRCKEIYKRNKLLSPRDRRLLCGSIVDYFVTKKIKFNTDIMDYVAEQIVEHFPTEDKKSWSNPGGSSGRGRFFWRYNTTCQRKAKQANKSTNSDEDSKCIQAWLKSNNCEDFSEIIDLWEDTMKYRWLQTKHLKDLESLLEFLNDWPSYKLQTGHELLTMDFQYLYPEAMETFRTRWLVYKQNIEQFLKVELKDVNCIKLLEKYRLQKTTTNEDSSSCILIYLVHAITKPLRHFEIVNGCVTYAFIDSQHSMTRLIQHKTELDEYTEPHPCIFVVGNSLLEVQECYVVFMDLRYKLSYEKCLAVCVQIFTVLKVEDPQASQCFWEFIRGYLFNIAKDKEKFKEATENIVNYLETVASSI